MKLDFIPLGKLSVSKTNMRYSKKAPDVSDLLPTVRKRGVLLPLLVRPNCSPDCFEIIAGRRRFTAAKIVADERRVGTDGAEPDEGTLPCAILDEGDDADAIEASLIENMARLDTDEVTSWETFTRLIKEGRTVEDIAVTFGLPDLSVRRILALGNLLPAIRAMFRREAIDAVSVGAGDQRCPRVGPVIPGQVDRNTVRPRRARWRVALDRHPHHRQQAAGLRRYTEKESARHLRRRDRLEPRARAEFCGIAAARSPCRADDQRPNRLAAGSGACAAHRHATQPGDPAMKHICLQCALLAGAMMLGASPANAEMRPHHWQVKRPVATVAAANRAASVVAFGQHRALVVWQRIIMPDGSSLKIDNVAATDAAGYAGLADKVDFHTWTLLKGVAISTLLGVGSTLGFTGGSDLVSAIRQAAQQNVARASDQLTSRNLQVQPTITIRPGTPVRLVVHRDLILEPWKE